MPSLEQLLVEYEDKDPEDIMAGEYVRRLAAVIMKEPNGIEFTRWLSKSMRQVLYDDMDDVVTGEQKQNGLILKYFANSIDAPSSIESFITTNHAQLLLKLLGFKPFNGIYS